MEAIAACVSFGAYEQLEHTHKSYFLGFNGNKGSKFINFLKNPKFGIKYYEDYY
jgi:hypothetical protein